MINISYYAILPEESRVAGREKKGGKPDDTFCVTTVFIEFLAGLSLNLLTSVKVYYLPYQISHLISAAINYSQLY